MTERIGIWIESASPRILHPIWLNFRASPLSVRLAHGVFWSLIGAVLARGLGVVSSIIVARMLGITAFGEFTMIQSTVGLFGTFAGLGLGITATKYVAELRETDPVRCGRIIGLILLVGMAGGLVAALALVSFAPWIATHTLAAPKLAPLLRVGATLVLFNTLQGVYSGALGGFEAFKRVAQINWVGAVLGTPLLVLCTFADGIRGAVWGSVLQVLLGCAIGHFALSREVVKRNVTLAFAPTNTDWRILWRFSLPVFLSEMIFSPANWISTTLLANQKAGFNEVALMNAAGQWRNIINFLPMMMTTVLVPMFSSLYQAGDQGAYVKLLRRNLLLNAGICAALAVPLTFCAPLVLNWYGHGFENGVPVLRLTLLTTIIFAGTSLFGRALQATGRAWIELLCCGIWAVTMVLGSFILVPSFKADGLAGAQLLATVVLAVCQCFLVRRIFSKRGFSGPSPAQASLVAPNVN
jgi:O-antigen/teichoic acid export membrane protein